MAAKGAIKDYTVMNHLIHDKLSSGEEVILLPYTMYENVLGAPKIVTSLTEFAAAPFFFYAQDDVEVSADELQRLFGTTFENA